MVPFDSRWVYAKLKENQLFLQMAEKNLGIKPFKLLRAEKFQLKVWTETESHQLHFVIKVHSPIINTVIGAVWWEILHYGKGQECEEQRYHSLHIIRKFVEISGKLSGMGVAKIKKKILNEIYRKRKINFD